MRGQTTPDKKKNVLELLGRILLYVRSRYAMMGGTAKTRGSCGNSKIRGAQARQEKSGAPMGEMQQKRKSGRGEETTPEVRRRRRAPEIGAGPPWRRRRLRYTLMQRKKRQCKARGKKNRFANRTMKRREEKKRPALW